MPLDSTNWSQTETETKPDMFSLEGLIAWLETQPPETKYDYMDTTDCLLVRWMRSTGHRDFEFAGSPDHNANLFTLAAAYTPRTYSAALSRARALLAKTRQ